MGKIYENIHTFRDIELAMIDFGILPLKKELTSSQCYALLGGGELYYCCKMCNIERWHTLRYEPAYAQFIITTLP